MRGVFPGWAFWFVLSFCVCPLSAVGAGEADIVDVKITKEGSGKFRFDVSVVHADKDFSHFADNWEVLAPDGTVLGTRVLLHPHVKEQPFTRYLPRVAIPKSIGEVRVRAHDNVHGYGGKEMIVKVPH